MYKKTFSSFFHKLFNTCYTIGKMILILLRDRLKYLGWWIFENNSMFPKITVIIISWISRIWGTQIFLACESFLDVIKTPVNVVHKKRSSLFNYVIEFYLCSCYLNPSCWEKLITHLICREFFDLSFKEILCLAWWK